MRDNVIRWQENDKRCLASFSDERMICRIRQLRRDYPQEIEIQKDTDTELLVSMPTTYVHLLRPVPFGKTRKKKIVPMVHQKPYILPKIIHRHEK